MRNFCLQATQPGRFGTAGEQTACVCPQLAQEHLRFTSGAHQFINLAHHAAFIALRKEFKEIKQEFQTEDPDVIAVKKKVAMMTRVMPFIIMCDAA